jgi:internalin A
VPEQLRSLTNLTMLDLRKNALDTLPEWFGSLTNLTTLQLSGNKLELPEWFGSLTNLTELDLSNNELNALPESLGSLTNLTELDLGNNDLDTLPEWFGSLTNLTELDLSNNELNALPESLGSLTNLTELHSRNNQLTALPDSLRALTNLTTLHLSGNRLRALPEWFGSLTSLTTLHLSGNELDVLSESLGSLTSLTTLHLSGNRLRVLPEWIGSLTNLTTLHLRNNELDVLPESLGFLTNLTTLYLSNNQLTALPDSLGSLINLTTLYLSKNQLTALPVPLGSLTSLTTLYLSGNKLSSPPPEVVASGTQAVLAYLRDRTTGTTVRLWASKLLVVGEATVGKTSLAKQLTGGRYDPEERQTHGVHIDPLALPHPSEPDTTMTLTVWDFGGQLEYRATQRFYLTDRSLFLLVWNARARWQDGKLLAWLDVITARAPQSPILVVATHRDDASAATLPADLRSRYPGIVGIHSVDARSGNGIDALREAIGRHSAALPLMGAVWPTTWVEARRAVCALDQDAPMANKVWETMTAAGVSDPEAHRAIARAMHDLGDVVFFADDRELSQKMILHPQWLDEKITAVLDSEAVAAADGVLTRTERDRVWAQVDPDLYDRLIRMMERFDLAYRTGDTDQSDDVALVVERLGYSRPPEADRIWHQALSTPETREVGLLFKLASRQAGIPTWFIARQHRYTTGLHWAHGVLLHDRDRLHPAYALLEDDESAQPTISLRVRGTFPVHLMSVLVESFQTIVNHRYPGLIRAILVPCTCQPASEPPCDHAFSIKELIAETQDPDPDATGKVRCPNSFRKIEARTLLDGLKGTGISQQIDTLQRTAEANAATLANLDHRQLDTLNGIRSLLAFRTQAGAHCPSLFSIEEKGRTGMLRRRTLRLSLWCEWPYSTGPHALDEEDGGVYILTSLPPWLNDYLPFLHALVTTLGIAAPLIAPALTVASKHLTDQATAGLDAATTLLTALHDIPAPAQVPDYWTPDTAPGPQHHAQIGADFRVLRNALRELDPQQLWGGLTPAIRPEDDAIVYLCDRHLRELDYPYNRTADSEKSQ